VFFFFFFFAEVSSVYGRGLGGDDINHGN